MESGIGALSARFMFRLFHLILVNIENHVHSPNSSPTLSDCDFPRKGCVKYLFLRSNWDTFPCAFEEDVITALREGSNSS